MIARALFYYQYHSWRNRLEARIRRLRQPKYLAGAIVGGIYFYFYLFRGIARGGRHASAATAIPSNMNDLPQTASALFLMFALLMAWILPYSRAALAFTEAEIAFLFPAPISRKTLLHFKLLKSQTAILFSALLMSLIGRGWGNGPLPIRALGWWAAFSVLNLHLLGSSFALTMLMDRGISSWKRRVLILGPAAAVVAGILIWARLSLPPFPATLDQKGYAWLYSYVSRAMESGPLPYLLMPFRMVVAPYFAASYKQFLIALVPVLGIIWLHYLWVIHSNVAFEEASLEFSRKLADRISAARSGNLRRIKKASRPPFVLRPSGFPAVAVFWKNLISAGQYVTARFWLMLVWFVIAAGVVVQSLWSRDGGIETVAIACVGMLLAMSLFYGPQVLRNDLRQDLPAADMLKMFPMPGWQVVLGEVLTPAVILTAVQWLLILFAIILFPGQIEKNVIRLALRLSVALSAAVVFPFVDLVALLIPNAAVLFFPAWFQLGKDVPRGFETIGQQMILMFGQLLVLFLGLLPAAGAFTLLLLGGSYVHWPLLGLMMGAVAAAIILAVEAAIGIKLLGGAFERFDVSGEVLV